MAGTRDASGNNPNAIVDGGSIENFAAKKGYVISPDDDNDLPSPTRGIYVGGVGDLTVELVGDPKGTTTLFSAVPVGTVLPIQARKVLATGTGATLMTALV
jgi:hypothetical protein